MLSLIRQGPSQKLLEEAGKDEGNYLTIARSLIDMNDGETLSFLMRNEKPPDQLLITIFHLIFRRGQLRLIESLPIERIADLSETKDDLMIALRELEERENVSVEYLTTFRPAEQRKIVETMVASITDPIIRNSRRDFLLDRIADLEWRKNYP